MCEFWDIRGALFFSKEKGSTTHTFFYDCHLWDPPRYTSRLRGNVARLAVNNRISALFMTSCVSDWNYSCMQVASDILIRVVTAYLQLSHMHAWQHAARWSAGRSTFRARCFFFFDAFLTLGKCKFFDFVLHFRVLGRSWSLAGHRNFNSKA